MNPDGFLGISWPCGQPAPARTRSGSPALRTVPLVRFAHVDEDGNVLGIFDSAAEAQEVLDLLDLSYEIDALFPEEER